MSKRNTKALNIADAETGDTVEFLTGEHKGFRAIVDMESYQVADAWVVILNDVAYTVPASELQLVAKA